MSNREEFEKWFDEFFDPEMAAEGSRDLTSDDKEQHWETWQAARAQSGQDTEPFAWCFTDVNGKPTEFCEPPEQAHEQDLRIRTPLYIKSQPDDDQELALACAYCGGAEKALVQQGSVPAGWKILPVHATADMVRRGKLAFGEEVLYHEDPETNIQGIWKAMLAISPEPPATLQPEGDGWIKCSERLPTEADADIFGNVWCSGFWDNPKRGIAPINWSNVGKGAAGDTHWKPTGLKRPQPPKEGEGDE